MQAGASNASQRGCEAPRGSGSLPAWKAPGGRVPTPCCRDAGPARNAGREGVSSSPQGRFAWKENARPEGVPERWLASKERHPGGCQLLACGTSCQHQSKPYAHSAGRPCARSPLSLIPGRAERLQGDRNNNSYPTYLPVPPPLPPVAQSACIGDRTNRATRTPASPTWFSRIRQRNASPPPTSSPRSAFKRKPSTSRSPAPAIPPP